MCDRGAINVTPSDGNNDSRGGAQEAVRQEPGRRQQVQRRQQAADHGERYVGRAERQHQRRRRSRGSGRPGHLRADAAPRSMWPASAATSPSTDARPTSGFTLQRGDVTLNEITGSAKITLDKGSIRGNNITGTSTSMVALTTSRSRTCKGSVRLEWRLLQRHPAEQDRQDGGVQVGALRYHAGLGAGRPGDLRRFPAGDRRRRPDAPGDSLQGHSPGRCHR